MLGRLPRNDFTDAKLVSHLGHAIGHAHRPTRPSAPLRLCGKPPHCAPPAPARTRTQPEGRYSYSTPSTNPRPSSQPHQPEYE